MPPCATRPLPTNAHKNRRHPTHARRQPLHTKTITYHMHYKAVTINRTTNTTRSPHATDARIIKLSPSMQQKCSMPPLPLLQQTTTTLQQATNASATLLHATTASAENENPHTTNASTASNNYKNTAHHLCICCNKQKQQHHHTLPMPLPIAKMLHATNASTAQNDISPCHHCV